MAQTMSAKPEAKNVGRPDETRSFEHGKLDVFYLEGVEAGCLTLDPGWRWSESVQPIAKTEYCQKHHVGYVLSGTLHVKMADGTEMEQKAGDFAVTPPGHDAWVVGDEQVKLLDFQGIHDYAKK